MGPGAALTIKGSETICFHKSHIKPHGRLYAVQAANFWPRCNFSGCDFRGADFKNVYFEDANMMEADFRGCMFQTNATCE